MFSNFDWSLKHEALMNDWYEQWSKAGAGPNFRVDPSSYIQGFNWVGNWIDKYFLTKYQIFYWVSYFC